MPGFIHLAEPRILDYNAFFKQPEAVQLQEQHNVEDRNYTPRAVLRLVYGWLPLSPWRGGWGVRPLVEQRVHQPENCSKYS